MAAAVAQPPKRQNRFRQYWIVYAMLIPGALYYLIFRYGPMWGLVIAFQDYSPFLGIFGSEWVGFDNFRRFFSEPAFWILLRNTLVISAYNLLIFFPFTILLAVLLSEVRNEKFRRTVQTVVYLPHFVSWVVVAALTLMLFGSDGFMNSALRSLGADPVNFLFNPDIFRGMITGQAIWKEAGWGTIIFLAALAGVDPTLYEAARVDGASRWRQIWHVTLPCIRSTILVLFVLRLGTVLDVGFEQIYLMQNPMVNTVGDVFETYSYRLGIQSGQFSYAATVGLFKSVVGFLMVYGSNLIAKKVDGEGIF